MPGPSRPSRQQYRTARQRIAARRSSTQQPRPQPGCRRRVLLLAGSVALLLTLLVAALLLRTFGALRLIQQADPRQAGAPTTVPGQTDATSAAPLPGSLGQPFNVLLLGVDLRDDPEEGARSDTLIVVHVDPAANWAGMLSIPRDSIATIPRAGMRAKINYAYSYGFQNAAALYGASTQPRAGGGALAAEAVEGYLGLKIDYIAQIDFHGFEQIVDLLGGVTLDVPRPLLDAEYPTASYGVERIYIPAGLQRLDGKIALRYARSRHADSDFGRSQRQQQVLRAMLDQARRKGLLEQAADLPQLLTTLERSVSTTLPVSDPAVLRGLVDFARALTPDRITQVAINADEVGLVAEDGSDLYWDEAGLKRQVARLLAGPHAASEQARIQVQNGAGVAGIAGQVSSYLAGQGFDLGDAGDADGAYAHSMIIDYSDKPQTRQRLASIMGIAPEYVLINPADRRAAAPPATDIVVIVGADYNQRWLAAP